MVSRQVTVEKLAAERLARTSAAGQEHEAPVHADQKVAADEEFAHAISMLKSYGTNVGAGTTIGLTAHETAQVLQGFWQSLNARKQQAGNLKSEAAEDSKKENAATLMASCIHNILGIVDRINELQEKEKHIGKFITIKQHEDWWKQILTEVAILALTPSRKLVSMDTLMKEFGLALAGVCWLWDRKRMMWISPSQMPVVADDYDLGQLLSQHTRTPIIALDEARTLVYHTHRSQPAAPTGKMFLEIFRRSNIPCLSEVVQEVPVYDHKSLAECPYGAALLQEVQTYVNSWAPLTFDSSQANSIIDAMRTRKVRVFTARSVGVQYTLKHAGAAETCVSQSKFAVWCPSAVADGTGMLLLRHFDDMDPQLKPEHLVKDVCTALAKSALEGCNLSPADITSLAVLLQPLIHPQLQQQQASASRISAADWKAFNEAVSQAAAKVTGPHDITMRQFLTRFVIELSKRPGVASQIFTHAWTAMNGESGATGSATQVVEWVLGKAAAGAVLLNINIAASWIPGCCYAGLPIHQAGTIGEVVATMILLALLVHLKWVFDLVEDVWPYGEHYDVRARDPDGQLYYFEIKSTRHSFGLDNAHTFELSELEHEQATQDEAHTCLVRMYGIPVLLPEGVYSCCDMKMLLMKNFMKLDAAKCIRITKKAGGYDVNVGNGV